MPKLLAWLAKTKPHEWINSVGVVVSILVAFGFVGTKIDDLKTIAVDNGVSLATKDGSAKGNPFYIVQLASYTSKDCASAEDEIASYKGRLGKAQLFSIPHAPYVVIGVAASDETTAQTVVRTAKALAEELPQHDLANARIRYDVNWSEATRCPSAS